MLDCDVLRAAQSAAELMIKATAETADPIDLNCVICSLLIVVLLSVLD